jgi:hypothetical protein
MRSPALRLTEIKLGTSTNPTSAMDPTYNYGTMSNRFLLSLA